jgi:hypothetical protein
MIATSIFRERWTFETWIAVAVLLLVIVASALAMSPSVADPDIWGHVQYGRDILATGKIPETNSYSFTLRIRLANRAY